MLTWFERPSRCKQIRYQRSETRFDYKSYNSCKSLIIQSRVRTGIPNDVLTSPVRVPVRLATQARRDLLQHNGVADVRETWDLSVVFSTEVTSRCVVTTYSRHE